MQLPSVSCVNHIRPWRDPRMCRRRHDVRRSALFVEIKMDTAPVSVWLAIFKLMCKRSLNNEVILLSIYCLPLWFKSSRLLQLRIVMSVAFQWRKNCMKCDIAVQTEVALQNIWNRTTYESGLGLIWKNRVCAVQTVIRKSDMGHIWAKKGFGPL